MYIFFCFIQIVVKKFILLRVLIRFKMSKTVYFFTDSFVQKFFLWLFVFNIYCYESKKPINFRKCSKIRNKTQKIEKEEKIKIKTHLDSSANFPASLRLKNKDTKNEHSKQNLTEKECELEITSKGINLDQTPPNVCPLQVWGRGVRSTFLRPTHFWGGRSEGRITHEAIKADRNWEGVRRLISLSWFTTVGNLCGP